MKATITMSLEDYEQMKQSLEDCRGRIDKMNRCLKTVYNIEIEDLLRRAQEIQDTKDRQAIHAAMMRGDL